MNKMVFVFYSSIFGTNISLNRPLVPFRLKSCYTSTSYLRKRLYKPPLTSTHIWNYSTLKKTYPKKP
uniref:Uncharacterized protein n=1 Tax=Lepeophtheirus salmonis TaxID=72036 RepID=A0A0K2TV21_LEPSM